MKTKLALLFSTIIVSFFASAQNTCNAYYPFKEGVTFEMTNYSKKGKKESAVEYHVSEINGNTATIKTTVVDDKNKEITTTSYEVTCYGNTISIDFKSMINPDILKQYKDMDMDISGTNIELPNDLDIGKKLKDANMVMSINMGGITMNMTMDMVNRTVDAKESITTPAGTFNCFAISYESQVKMGIKTSFTIKEWIAEGVGVVKTESYNKKGKLMGYSELTSISQ
ncbi:TapB family protein [Jejuia pallidilutea]|uniref:DUF3108 domain-containing protein n=1 Tax=Jejuia pallidilutea TaxID=504487 RepID=A0A090WC53_9FLAO|nr:hypothetical protein [Jejuia pallidilutea]GAL68911.1 hypothetical protein JCM19301_2930 [Jejuia pallidilutea]GAL72984.1 hypothetical protein JCM19302_261 [Jejuia pallidilutea]GAL91036.1 hypothetical protein JCM19538_2650 [Jejuia pallidilutea]